jgi:hypothetical protein
MGAAAAASGGEAAYVPSGAIVLNGSDEYLARTPSSGSASTKFTLSIWFKRGTFSEQYLFMQGSDANNLDVLEFTADATIQYREYTGSVTADLITTQVFRDPTAWYHLVLSYDTTLEAAVERVKLYINGDRVTAFGTQSNPSSDSTSMIGGTSQMTIGRKTPGTTWYYPGYLSEYIFLDGYAALPTDFGTTNSNNLWVPKDPTDSVTANKGTNGFWLDFADSSDLGNDVSGNNNDFTPYNMGTTNSVLDRCADNAGTNVGNYWTLSPLAATDTLTNGNLSFTGASNFSTYVTAPALPMTGKWYYEVKATGGDQPIGASASYDAYLGLVRTDIAIPTGSHTSNPGLWVIANWNPTPSGQKNNNSTATYTPTTGFADGSIIMVAVDLDNNAIWFGNDGTWAGSATASEIAAGTTTNAAFTNSNNSFGSNQMMPYQANYDDLATYNFGATAFAHTPPTGFKALSTANLPEPTVKNGENKFLPIIYEGNGAGQRVGNFIPFTDSHTVDNSCVFEEGDTDYLTRSVWGTDTDSTKFTFSYWVKRGTLGKTMFVSSGPDINNQTVMQFDASDRLDFILYVAPGIGRITSNRVFKQTDTWTHIVIVHDSSNGTANDKMRMYVNGVRITDLQTNDNPSGNYNKMTVNGANTVIGYDLISTADAMDGYMAEVIFVDGYALDASPFGETDTSTNRWIPKTVTAATLNTAGGGSSGFGTNGFYLEFETDSALGTDTSGNTNTFTPTNIAAANQTDDTPTKNIATLDSNAPTSQTGSVTVSSGNRKVVGPSTAFWGVPSNMTLPSSGKFYAEAQINGVGTSGKGGGVYVMEVGTELDVVTYTGGQEAVWGWHFQDNRHLVEHGADTSVAGANADGDIAQIAIDIDNAKVYMGINNTWYSAVNTTTTAPDNSGTATFSLNCAGMQIAANGYGSSGSVVMNFGATDFAHTPPTDFVALTQDNLDANTAGITGFSWIKNRDAGDNNILQDRVRGATNYSISNSAAIQATDANSVQKFLQQGVQVGNMDAVNTSAESYVLWQWAANGTGTTNSDGSGADVTVSANTTSEFSIVKYVGDDTSGRTIGTGLTAQPAFILIKNLDNASYDWQVYHKSVGNTASLSLNVTDIISTSSTYWNNTSPATSAPFVFSLGNSVATNKASDDFIAYVWAEVEGYSKFGTYIGNSDPDGPYVNLGFSPSYVMIKRTDVADEWVIVDSTRSPYNPTKNYLAANYPDAERTTGTQVELDWLSNGFKLRVSHARCNVGTYIYAAFASNPFGGSGVGQARAR